MIKKYSLSKKCESYCFKSKIFPGLWYFWDLFQRLIHKNNLLKTVCGKDVNTLGYSFSSEEVFSIFGFNKTSFKSLPTFDLLFKGLRRMRIWMNEIVCKILTKYWFMCDKVFRSLTKHSEVWQSIQMSDRVFKCVTKYSSVWWSIQKCDVVFIWQCTYS